MQHGSITITQATTGFDTTSTDASTPGIGRAAASPGVSLTVGNLARHLERLSAGSAARAAAAFQGSVPPKGFADLPTSVEALILHDAFKADGRTLQSWLNLSLVSRCDAGRRPLTVTALDCPGSDTALSCVTHYSCESLPTLS